MAWSYTLGPVHSIHPRDSRRTHKVEGSPAALAGRTLRPAKLIEEPMQNYFNYFTEIEKRFQQRRDSLLMLSTLDWALIETWKEAGIPLEAVLRGIDNAFDKHDAKVLRAPGRTRKVNGLAWCAQSVMEAVEQANEAAIGARPSESTPDSGFESDRVARFLETNAASIESANLQSPANATAAEVTARLKALALELRTRPAHSLEELDRTLSVLEEKLFAALLTTTPESSRSPARAGDQRPCALSRQDAGRADQTSPATIPAKAPSRSQQITATKPLLHEPRMKLRIEKAIYGGSGLAHQTEGKDAAKPSSSHSPYPANWSKHNEAKKNPASEKQISSTSSNHPSAASNHTASTSGSAAAATINTPTTQRKSR